MKRYLTYLLPVFALFMLQPGEAHAYLGLCCSKCGGNMPLNIPGGGVPETSEFRFKISPVFMRMEGLRDGTTSIDTNSLLGMPAAGKFMAVQENMDMYMLNVALGYSFSDDFFAGIMGMYQANRMDMRFNTVMQGMTGMPGYTMESDGLKDTMLMSKYRIFADDPMIPASQASLLLGLNMPTGSINKRNTTHPLGMRQKELLPYGMQLGSGTFDPVLGLLYQGSSSPWWWGVNGTYTGRWYDNDRDYRLGDQYNLDAYLMYQLRYDWVLEFQLNGESQGKIRGEADESLTGASGHAVQGNPNSPFMTPLWDTANYGGTNLFATIGLQWQPVPLHILNVQVGLPLYRDLNGPQLEKDWRIQFTWYMELPTRDSIRHGGKSEKPSKLGF